MDNDKDYKISTRPVSGRKLVSELDTSTGISYNGTTHSEPDKSKATDKVRLRKFFLKESEEMPLKYKKSMVKNEKLILDLLPAEDHEKARQQIEEYRQELMNKDSN